MFKPRFIVASLALGLTALASAQTTIEKVAPENTVFILGADSVTASFDRLKRTGLWDVWESDKMQAALKDMLKEMSDDINEAMKDLGVEEDSLVPPTGPTGVAVFPIMDKDLGISQPGFLLVADYGENADKTAALLKALNDRDLKKGEIEIEEKEVLGRTITIMHRVDKEEDADDAAGDEVAEDEFQFEEGPNPMEQAMKDIHYLREGNMFMASNNLEALTAALEVIDGKGEKTIADRTEYQSMLGKIGEHDCFAMLLTRDLMDMMGGEMGMMQMMVPMIRSAVGHVKGYGLGMRLDGPAAMVEQTLAVYMPDGKVGLTTLVDLSTPRTTPPAFVGPDAVSYTTFNFKFGDLMDTVNKIIAGNPMLQAQLGDGLAQSEPQIRAVLDTLGTQVHVTSSASKPLSDGITRGVLAVQCTKPQEFENQLAKAAADMGVDARDFLGQRIYTLPAEAMGMMMPGMDMGDGDSMSLGIGGGFIVMGATPAVEQSLRATSQTGVATLAADESFSRAVSALGDQPAVGWSFSNTIDQMEVMLSQQRKAMNDSIEQIREFAPEAAEQMQAENALALKMMDAVDFDLLRRYIGPSVWRVQSIDDGFLMHSYTLSAAPKASN